MIGKRETSETTRQRLKKYGRTDEIDGMDGVGDEDDVAIRLELGLV